MLEWYRVAEDYAVLMEDVAAMARLACTAASHGAALHQPVNSGFRDESIPLRAEWS